MQEVYNRYVAYLEAERNVSAYTVRNYTKDLLEFFAFVHEQGIDTLKNVNKQTLRAYLAQLMEQKYAKSSIARKLSAIRSFYRYLMREVDERSERTVPEAEVPDLLRDQFGLVVPG